MGIAARGRGRRHDDADRRRVGYRTFALSRATPIAPDGPPPTSRPASLVSELSSCETLRAIEDASVQPFPRPFARQLRARAPQGGRRIDWGSAPGDRAAREAFQPWPEDDIARRQGPQGLRARPAPAGSATTDVIVFIESTGVVVACGEATRLLLEGCNPRVAGRCRAAFAAGAA